jgi:hypothetical protein
MSVKQRNDKFRHPRLVPVRSDKLRETLYATLKVRVGRASVTAGVHPH